MSFYTDADAGVVTPGIYRTQPIVPLPNGDLLALVTFPNTRLPLQAAIISSDLSIRATLTKAGGAFELTLTTIPQMTYSIESSSDLVNWQPHFTTTSTDYRLKLPIPKADSQKFFRIKQP